MFLNVYLDLAILTFHISCCACYVGYEMFQGFDTYNTIKEEVSTHASVHKTTIRTHAVHRHVSATVRPKKSKKVVQTTTSPRPPVHSTTTSKALSPSSSPPSSLPSSPPPSPSTIYPKFLCPEDERPFNIGTYEVPTQRDMVLQIQRTLTRMFDTYQEKAMDFLQDIQEATKATSDIEKKCYNGPHNHQKAYKKCVKQISKKCEYITKSIVTSLERQRADVSAFIKGTICTVTEMKADPLQLIKVLAMEQASLDFALPGFLRLLGSCSAICNEHVPNKSLRKPVRHMTDQDLVIKHFLTKKSYVQLLKDSK